MEAQGTGEAHQGRQPRGARVKGGAGEGPFPNGEAWIGSLKQTGGFLSCVRKELSGGTDFSRAATAETKQGGAALLGKDDGGGERSIC